MPIKRKTQPINSTYDPTSGLFLHQDTLSWVRAVRSESGSVSNTNLNKIDTYVRWAYTNGYRDVNNTTHKLIFWLPLRTNDFNGAFIPIWHPQGNNVRCINTNFVSSDYTLSTGFTGAAGKNIHSLVYSQNISFTSNGMLVQSNNQVLSDNTLAMGFISYSPQKDERFNIALGTANGGCYVDLTDPTVISVTQNNSVGTFLGIRDSNNDCGLYRDNVTIGEKNQAPVNTAFTANIPIYLFTAYNVPFSDTGFYAAIGRQLRGFMVMTGLTRTEGKAILSQYLSTIA